MAGACRNRTHPRQVSAEQTVLKCANWHWFTLWHICITPDFARIISNYFAINCINLALLFINLSLICHQSILQIQNYKVPFISSSHLTIVIILANNLSFTKYTSSSWTSAILLHSGAIIFIAICL